VGIKKRCRDRELPNGADEAGIEKDILPDCQDFECGESLTGKDEKRARGWLEDGDGGRCQTLKEKKR